MKNFQQTPKQRRVALAKAKTSFQNSRNQSFQPRAAWETKQKAGGVPLDVLMAKQLAAGGCGFQHCFYYRF